METQEINREELLIARFDAYAKVNKEYESLEYALCDLAASNPYIWNTLEEELKDLWRGSDNDFDELYQGNLAELFRQTFIGNGGFFSCYKLIRRILL